MRAVVGWSLRFRLVVLGLAAGAMVLGFTQLSRQSLETLPEFGPPYVEIQTEALGLSAQEVEELITVPLEADLLHGVAFLDEIHSQSVPGLSSIVLYFERGTDIFRARQVVAERLTQAHALPNVSKSPAMLQPLSSESRVMMVGLSSTQVSLIEMSVLGRWTIRPRLLSVPGVANVAIWGQRERQLQVQVDPARLRDRGVSLSQVIETAGNAMWVSPLTFLDASTPGTGGFIDTPNQRLGIQHILPIRTPDDLAQVAIVSDRPLGNGPQLKLGDVATIVEDHQPLIGDAVVNDGPGLVMVIEKFPGADTIEVTRNVEAALNAMQPGLAGIQVDSSLFRPATYLEAAARNVILALLIGLVLVVGVLGAVMRHWRAALIGVVAVPLSLEAGALVMVLLGLSFNAFAVAGLVLAAGILIDDAVAGFEAAEAARLQPSRGEARSLAGRMVEAVLGGRGPLLYATLIVGCSLVPAMLATGALGAFLPSLVLPFALAVVASMLVALTVTPALCAVIPSGRPSIESASPIVRRLRAAYGRALEPVIDRARTAGIIAVGASIIGVVLFAAILPRVAASPVPQLADRDLLLRWDAVAGTSATEMDRILGLAGEELHHLPGVRSVGGHLGRAVLSDQLVGVNSGELWLSLKPEADYPTTLASIRKIVNAYPGFHHEIGTYSAARVDAILPASQADLVVRVYGQDLDVLGRQAEDVRQAVNGVGGVKDTRIDAGSVEATLKIEADLVAADRVGLKPGDIRRAATTLLSGILVGSLFEDQKVFEVVVWGIPGIRENLTAIADLPIDTPAGRQVRLGDVASVTIGPSPSVIRREGVFRYVDIDVTVAGDPAGVARNLDRAIKTIQMPLEYRAEVLGGYAEELAATSRLVAAAIAAAVVILLLLQAAFLSWRLAALGFVGLLAALAGAAAGAWATGDAQSIGSLAGLLLVLGIAARTGIRLIRDCQRLEGEAGLDRRTTVFRAASGRLTALVATIVATALALAPFLVLGERPGIELIRPMAVVILGGLLTTTLVNLFVLPILYVRFAPGPIEDPGAQLAGEEPALAPSTA